MNMTESHVIGQAVWVTTTRDVQSSLSYILCYILWNVRQESAVCVGFFQCFLFLCNTPACQWLVATLILTEAHFLRLEVVLWFINICLIHLCCTLVAPTDTCTYDNWTATDVKTPWTLLFNRGLLLQGWTRVLERVTWIRTEEMYILIFCLDKGRFYEALRQSEIMFLRENQYGRSWKYKAQSSYLTKKNPISIFYILLS